MTIASEISRLQSAKANIKTAIEGKGVTIPSAATLDGYDDYITAIEQKGYDGPFIVLDIKGPAPDGFHVPLTTEWQGLKTIMDGLSLTTGNGWKINLHMPFAGKRSTSASITLQGSYCFYWSSSPYISNYPYRSYLFCFDSSTIYANTYDYRAEGYAIRCFKNSFEIPTSSWTIIQGTLGGAGIFWNQTDGIISITSNGTTGYTIMDKNLGATVVYNNGDTLTKNNMGNIYQWGNNYGFSSTGNISTSSITVNVSGYGPGNYYSGSVFRTGNSDWADTKNDNLRGGVSQGSEEYVTVNGTNYYKQ